MSGKNGEAEAAKAEDFEISQEQAQSIMDKGYSEDDIAKMTEEDVVNALSESEESEEPAPNTITEDMVKEYGLTNSFVGKPVTELAKAYSEAQKTLNRKETEFQKTLRELKENNKESIQDIALLEPDQQQEALAKLIDQKLAPFQQIINERREKEFMGELQTMLPEGQDVHQVINEWKSSRNLTESDINTYLSNPNIFVDSVVNFANHKVLLDKLASTEKNGKKDAKKELAKKITSQLKSPSQDGTYKLEKEKDGSLAWTGDGDLDDMLTRIYAKNAKKQGVK